MVDSYIHFNNTVGVLVEVNCETDFVANTDEFRDAREGRRPAHREPVGAALAQPRRRPGRPSSASARIFEAQAKESGKPENVVAKIVEGKLEPS